METSCTVKIIDGLYLGDESTARDQDFLLLNHVGFVINMTGQHLPNYYQHYEIAYANLLWGRDGEEEEWEDICQDIEEVRQQGECVVLHGADNIEGPACLGSLYLMNKFRWSLYKTLEYMQARIDNLAFCPQSFQRLKTAEMKLLGQRTKLSYNWDQRPSDPEELVLRNTFLNCRQGQERAKNSFQPKTNNKSTARLKPQQNPRNNLRRVTWQLLKAQNTLKNMSNSSKRQRQSSQPENKLKNRIIMSVRKILNNSTSNKDISENGTAKTLSQKTLNTEIKNQEYLTLKKHKSSYGLICLKSIQNTERNLHKFDSYGNNRLLTEQMETLEENDDLKGQIKMKTEGVQINGKMVIDVHIPKSSDCFKSCKSLTLRKQKQNLAPSKLKIPLRRPTPAKR